MIQTMLFLILLVPVTAQVDYNSQIQPIFDDRCVSCHGSMGGLNLTSYENLMDGGLSGDEVIPYDHASSELWIRVNSGQMPPGNNDLTDVQVDLIAQWIDEGALPEISEISGGLIRPADGEWVDPEQVKMIQQQAGLSSWTLHEKPLDEHQMRTLLFAELDKLADHSTQPLVIPVDQYFNVKGVGLVAIGYVQSGTVNKHDRLLALPIAESEV